jgi:pantoate--beta-alanine ligase
MRHYKNSLSGTVGFIPTMGALHEGHLSLIKTSLAQNTHTVVSIYVNPTQFLAGEDLDKYPRTLEQDLALCKKLGVSGVFVPNNLYAKDEVFVAAPKIKGYVLEGHFRPGHFDGVLTVVLKLLNLVRPTNAYFGQKDAQQLVLIKQLAQNLFLDTNIVGLPTLRDSDGLAKSSRNVYLSKDERQKALSIYRCLSHIKNNTERKSLSELKDEATQILKVDTLQYLAFTDYNLCMRQTFKKGDTLVLIAAYVGSTRLIDNVWL